MRNIQVTQQTLDDLEKRGSVVFGAEVIADGWIEMTPGGAAEIAY